MRYTILRHDDVDELIGQVQKFIDDGWKPIGGVCFGSVYATAGKAITAFVNTPRPSVWAQTMVREDPA